MHDGRARVSAHIVAQLLGSLPSGALSSRTTGASYCAVWASDIYIFRGVPSSTSRQPHIALLGRVVARKLLGVSEKKKVSSVPDTRYSMCMLTRPHG